MPRKKARKNRRRLNSSLHEPVRHRFNYLCDLLFASDGRDMAFALDLNYRELKRVFDGDLRITVRLLVHVVAKLGVSPAWLLCGVGSVYSAASAENEFSFPAAVQSSFPFFDVTESFAPATLPAAKHIVFPAAPISDEQSYLLAGKAVYRARSHNKLIGFFLGYDAFAFGGAAGAVSFFEAGFGGLLCMTLSAACFDLAAACVSAAVDINAAAKLAANRGIGYGEALALSTAAPVCNRAESVLTAIADIGAPTVLAAEIGEIAAHTAPSLNGLDTGAAIGVATYVDLLILTEQLKLFFDSPGGVFIVAGEHARGVRFILQRIESLRAGLSRPTDFTFVVFAPRDPILETLVHEHGGHVIFLTYPTAAAFAQLLQTCNDVYAGKISHDYK